MTTKNPFDGINFTPEDQKKNIEDAEQCIKPYEDFLAGMGWEDTDRSFRIFVCAAIWGMKMDHTAFKEWIVDRLKMS